MLSGIERKLTSLVADGLAARSHLSVLEAPGSTQAIAAARGALLVSVSEAGPRESFEPGFNANLKLNGNAAGRRILPLGFSASLDFRHAPAGQTDAQRSDARVLLLDDVALTAHLLSAEDFRTGKAFANGPADPGFQVLSFQLHKTLLGRDVSDLGLTASLEYRGIAEIWPPGVTQAQGTVVAVETFVATQPVEIRVLQPVVRQGGATELRVGPLPGTTATRGALRLAVRVVSSLPPAQRGKIANGVDGAETGSRLVPADALGTVLQYSAPAGALGATRAEFIEVHLATPDNRMGVFIGSAAIQLLPKLP